MGRPKGSTVSVKALTVVSNEDGSLSVSADGSSVIFRLTETGINAAVPVPVDPSQPTVMLGLETAKTAYNELSGIAKRIESANKTLGDPKSLRDQLVRVAIAMHAKQINFNGEEMEVRQALEKIEQPFAQVA